MLFSFEHAHFGTLAGSDETGADGGQIATTTNTDFHVSSDLFVQRPQNAQQTVVVGGVADGDADVVLAGEGLLVAAVFDKDVVALDEQDCQLRRRIAAGDLAEEIVGLAGDDAQEGNLAQFECEALALLLE